MADDETVLAGHGAGNCFWYALRVLWRVSTRSKLYQLEHGPQPYFKLHGSCNWRDGDSPILIMGGNKGPDIDKPFLLRSYRDRFWQYIGSHGELEKLDRRDAANFFLDISVPDYHDEE